MLQLPGNSQCKECKSPHPLPQACSHLGQSDGATLLRLGAHVANHKAVGAAAAANNMPRRGAQANFQVH